MKRAGPEKESDRSRSQALAANDNVLVKVWYLKLSNFTFNFGWAER